MAQRSLHLLVLVGIVFGLMIRSFTGLLQRVMDPLAFAVLQDAGFASLDMRHAVSMMKRLRGITDELGKTVVLVLHDINFASTYADSILAMKDGRIIQHAAPDEVMTGTIRPWTPGRELLYHC